MSIQVHSLNELNEILREQPAFKVLEIGEWDMDANSVPANPIPHGLDHTTIRSVSVLIRNDNNTLSVDFDFDNLAGSINAQGIQINNTNVVLNRAGSGFFDGVNYNDTAVNRGWVTIVYKND